ncbi:hypothetical protein SAMN02745157_4965 [Kaistia soli DSM 19436]|uniref:Cytochrome c domain-containing protein n=1 Tax=Kaistia soli DSM 19436 TaxID=1122133 RepID=A0A1M5NBU0_9HYPH|nr:cytochrome c [Kaistia soli]SHG86463.1 hypothetical protein SAMN02745157_4965 [Kaistia soli DSM 19436]
MSTIMRRIVRFLAWGVAILAGVFVLVAIGGIILVRSLVEPDSGKFGHVEDEARHVGLDRSYFHAADDPYFVDLDKGLLKKPAPGAAYPPEIMEVATTTGLAPEAVRQSAIKGQNAWIVWTGGNDRFWDFAANTAIGSFDLLKTISSHPSQAYGRPNRWRYLGLSNEPCFSKATGPDPKHFGLWIDQRDPNCPADPFGGNPEADARYPGVRTGARGTTFKVGTQEVSIPVGSYYGEPTGVLGLRLFPNPDFDAEAAKHWDSDKYYTDEKYYNDKTLVRPYRVGMSCAFCHLGPNPINAPKSPEHPRFSELTSNPGAQYFWVDRIFFWNTRPRDTPDRPAPNEGNFLFQLFHTNPPGSLDTSLVSTDYINNPRTMNAVYDVMARMRQAPLTGAEQLKGDERDNKQFQDYPQTAALGSFYDNGTGKGASMRVLKDGSDSVGALGALNRVYLNIGLFSEEWLLHFRAFLGGQKISPIRIADAQKNSAYWGATEDMTADMAIFFLVTARADRLADIPEGTAVLAKRDAAAVDRGKVVFAETCAACHSSSWKQPAPPASYGVDSGICAGGGSGPHYRECWDRYWAWTQTETFKRGMVAEVNKRDADGKETFLDGNFLSTERRVPLDVIGTNACSALATNGLSGDIWDNFTSDTYKSLPPPHEIAVNHPVSGAAMPLRSLGNGRGYIRPASLISLWSSAPYLLNNSIGYDEAYYGPGYRQNHRSGPSYDYGASCPGSDPSNPDLPCIENRLALYDRSIREMLWPQTRRMDTMTDAPVPGYIYRTTAPSCLKVPSGFSPSIVKNFAGPLNWLFGWAVAPDGALHLGPFPKGFPINALVNTKLLPDNDEPSLAHYWRLLSAAPTLYSAFSQLGGQCTDAELADPGVQVHAETVMRETKLVDTLVGLSKCPDYVVNRGHLFGTDLPDPDKQALIAYLKQF